MALRRFAAVLLVGALAALSGCTTAVDGTGTIGLHVIGDSHSAFDSQAKTAISAVLSYWNATYPVIDHGHRLPQLRGKLYSVDGAAVVRHKVAPPVARTEKCLQEQVGFIIDNAAYCELDDSIVWDRSPGHLLPVLARAYGPAVTALVFAHEFGHAVQARLHINDEPHPTIDLESQADCAAGAFAAAALAGKVPQLQLTPAALDRALEGYLQIRDSTPQSPEDISHGDGFDRLNAIGQGIRSGASYCFGPSFFDHRTYTERGYVSDQDYLDQGNQPLSAVLNPKGLVTDLNRFWTSAAKQQGKHFAPVTIKAAAHPACGAVSSASEFGYCPADNTVYYSAAFAHAAYYSITVPIISPSTGDVQLDHHQPGDFALGMLFAIGWGLAAEHQLHDASTTTATALSKAVCAAGAYAADINRADYSTAHPYVLSPPDMDEATSAVLELVGLDRAFGARGTTGLQRVNAVVTGYTHGRAGC